MLWKRRLYSLREGVISVREEDTASIFRVDMTLMLWRRRLYSLREGVISVWDEDTATIFRIEMTRCGDAGFIVCARELLAFERKILPPSSG
jgi:hypothetical protein